MTADLRRDRLHRRPQRGDLVGKTAERPRFAAARAMLVHQGTQAWVAVERRPTDASARGDSDEGDRSVGTDELGASALDTNEELFAHPA